MYVRLQSTYVVVGVVACFLLLLLALSCSVRVVPRVSGRVFHDFHASYLITARHAPSHPAHAAFFDTRHDEAWSCTSLDACDVGHMQVTVENTFENVFHLVYLPPCRSCLHLVCMMCVHVRVCTYVCEKVHVCACLYCVVCMYVCMYVR